MNNVKIKDIYDFYTKKKIKKLLKGPNKEILNEEEKGLNNEIDRDRQLFNHQLNSFIKKYMRWHFSLTETSFLKSRITKKTNFIFKRVTISPDAKKIARLDYDRNCFDIAFLSLDTKLFKDFLMFIRNRL